MLDLKEGEQTGEFSEHAVDGDAAHVRPSVRAVRSDHRVRGAQRSIDTHTARLLTTQQ